MSKYRKGDVFCIMIDDHTCRYFQYIGNDSTQLGSNVIRVFKRNYLSKEAIDFYKVVKDEVDFYAHVVLKVGEKHSIWKKVGNIDYSEMCEIIFRDSSDYGNPDIQKSKNWWIWKINDDQKKVDEESISILNNTEIGIVINPNAILKRLETGRYQFFYPDF